jgi:microcystin-dependent protein
MEGYIASILMFGGNFAPRNWAYCEGQVMPLSQNTALFSLIGTTYGGNGQTTFQLPDMRGRVPMHPGQGPGLSSHSLGEKGGVETVALTPPQIGALSIPTSKGTEQPIPVPGGAQPHTNLQPYLCVNFIICLYGIFPSRS